MYVRSARCRVAGLATLLCTAACFHTTAPSGWLPRAPDVARDAYGGWIDLSLAAGGRVLGELIAAHDDTVFVLSGGSLAAVANRDVVDGTLTAYDQPWGEIALWGGLGALATLSHGWWLIFTMPTWAISGTVAAASASRAPRGMAVDRAMSVRRLDPTALRPYARFPQGLPAGLDRRSLRGKGRGG